MEKDTYQTIKESARGLFKDKGSKFIALAFPVKTEDEIKEILENLRKEYHDARHHCYGWRLGSETNNFRANDDGEPSGTAGRPILAQIQKHELTNILVVVVRYFGGILLGTGGLISAYRSAAVDAIGQTEIITATIDEIFEIKFPYSSINDVMTVLKDERADQLEQYFDMSCRVKVKIPRGNCERFSGRLNMIDSVILKKLSINY